MTPHGPADDALSQYVAGTLPADELEEFEQHLLGCEACRTAVRAAAAARVALVTAAPTSAGRVRESVARRRAFHFHWLGTAAAAAIILAMALRGDSSGSTLGDITPAPFIAAELRPSGDAATALVDSGMMAYVVRDFAGAAGRLRRAARTDSSASVAFYLGVSLLMRGENRAALAELARSARSTAYAAEAAYYMAKALVRLDHPDSALAVLDRAAIATPDAGTLKAFADSIRRQ